MQEFEPIVTHSFFSIHILGATAHFESPMEEWIECWLSWLRVSSLIPASRNFGNSCFSGLTQKTLIPQRRAPSLAGVRMQTKWYNLSNIFMSLSIKKLNTLILVSKYASG
jgi:hypothetical protein